MVGKNKFKLLRHNIESEKDYKVEIAAPGLTKDDFRLGIDDDNQISVSGRRKRGT